MKKSVALMTLLTLVSGSAFATKARMAALGNAAFVTNDTQAIFDNIGRITAMPDFAVYEFGETSTRSLGINTLDSDFNDLSSVNGLYDSASATSGRRIYAATAEGGFVMSSGNHKYGFYMGRKSQFTTLARSIGGFLGQENSIEAMYGNKAGEIGWGVSLNYSASDKKGTTVAQKQSAAGIRFGAVASNWDAYAIFGLGSSADGASKSSGGSFTAISDAAATYRGTTGLKFGGGYWLDTWYLNANFYQDGAKLEYGTAPGGAYAATTKYLLQRNNVEQAHWEIGAINVMKNDASTFFYGFSYNTDTADNKENSTESSDPYKLEKTSMPVFVGFEHEAASWITFRASVKQNVLLSSKKSSGGEANTVNNNTTANAGVGLKWNKLALDASISKSSTPNNGSSGDINDDNLFANTSVTYLF